MDQTGGLLHVTIIEARLSRDVELFGTQDPYCKIEYMGRKYETQVCLNGGKNPVWNNSFDFELQSVKDDLEIQVKDKNLIGAEMIGGGVMKASSLCINNGVRDWFPIEYDNDRVGDVLIETRFTPRYQ